MLLSTGVSSGSGMGGSATALVGDGVSGADRSASLTASNLVDAGAAGAGGSGHVLWRLGVTAGDVMDARAAGAGGDLIVSAGDSDAGGGGY
jgi:hypothetical protein